jgi:hypothetical protein
MVIVRGRVKSEMTKVTLSKKVCTQHGTCVYPKGDQRKKFGKMRIAARIVTGTNTRTKGKFHVSDIDLEYGDLNHHVMYIAGTFSSMSNLASSFIISSPTTIAL